MYKRRVVSDSHQLETIYLHPDSLNLVITLPPPKWQASEPGSTPARDASGIALYSPQSGISLDPVAVHCFTLELSHSDSGEYRVNAIYSTHPAHST